MMEKELTDLELARLIRIYSELTTKETDPARKKLFHKTLCSYCAEAKKVWFGS